MFTKIQLLLLLAVSYSNSNPETGGFRQFSLYHHNVYRSKSGLTPLKLSDELNIIAHSHAEKLAAKHGFENSNNGYGENLWAHTGTLRPLTINCRDAINNWFTGSTVPGNVISKVDREALFSNSTQTLGIGVGTFKDYTVMVANYN